MRLNEFMEERKSYRDYKNKKLSSKELEQVEEILKDINEKAKEHNVNFKYYNGENIFKGLEGEGGYYGTMIKAPGYISMAKEEINDKSYIFGAYFLEKIVGKLSDIGLGTCWVSLFNVKDELKEKVFQTNDKIDFVLAFGHPAGKSLFSEEQYSNRISIEEYVFYNDFNTPAKVEDLEHYGLEEIFYYLRYAPSSFNKQPWRFLIKDNKIYLYIENFEGNVNLTDSGIVMYYFEELAALTGVTAKWELDVNPNIVTDKKFIGRTNF